MIKGPRGWGLDPALLLGESSAIYLLCDSRDPHYLALSMETLLRQGEHEFRVQVECERVGKDKNPFWHSTSTKGVSGLPGHHAPILVYFALLG